MIKTKRFRLKIHLQGDIKTETTMQFYKMFKLLPLGTVLKYNISLVSLKMVYEFE